MPERGLVAGVFLIQTRERFLEHRARDFLRWSQGGQRESHSHTEGEVVIFEGTFSWWAAWCMMIWVP